MRTYGRIKVKIHALSFILRVNGVARKKSEAVPGIQPEFCNL
jgi:hypothetical protein